MSRDKSTMLEKAAVLLEAFPGDSPLTLAQVCERTGLARSTAHRLLGEVAELGWVTRSGNRFDLGMALFELGERVAVKHSLRSVALPFMQDLFAVTRATVHLAVRDGVDAVYVEKIHGHGALSLPSRTGGRAPLTCTAVGKALLAHETPAVRHDVLGRPLRRWTAKSVTEASELARQLEEIRRTGSATEREEAASGCCCVAAPVLLAGAPVAALSVAVPTEAFDPAHLAPAVRTGALAISRALGRARRPTP